MRHLRGDDGLLEAKPVETLTQPLEEALPLAQENGNEVEDHLVDQALAEELPRRLGPTTPPRVPRPTRVPDVRRTFSDP